jgi:predicted AAA+ superfamily ATPase
LWEEFKFYLVTGGLPEVVSAFMRNRANLFAAFEEVRALQTRLVSGYLADMAKHCGKQNAMHLERLWRNIPTQLGRDQSASAPKFVFRTCFRASEATNGFPACSTGLTPPD